MDEISPGEEESTSSRKVAGFIATMMSTPPRRPRCPASLTRTSYQVGSPWMFEGKMLARADRDPHPEHRLREQVVRARRARAVDVGELDDEVVD